VVLGRRCSAGAVGSLEIDVPTGIVELRYDSTQAMGEGGFMLSSEGTRTTVFLEGAPSSSIYALESNRL
jgi:hypothetical protein